MNVAQESHLNEQRQEGSVPAAPTTPHLQGELIIPAEAKGIVLFAHASGSSRQSTRNQEVARVLRQGGLGTLLFDLLTSQEEELDMKTRHLRFNIDLLAGRLVDATQWIIGRNEFKDLPIGYLGSSTGAAAALIAAAMLGKTVQAVVSRGGRPDLAGDALSDVRSATLLIVGERDESVAGLNEQALLKLNCAKEFKTIPNATHLFEEPGALEEVSSLAKYWFVKTFRGD